MDLIKVKNPFRVICIDNSNKPENIDNEQWIENDTEYIVTDMFRDLISDEISFKLLDKEPEPFKGYVSSRFKMVEDTFSVN